MSWEGRNVQVKIGYFLRGFWVGTTVAETEVDANGGDGGKWDVPGADWNGGVVSNAEASGGPGHGELEGEGRDVALVDLEWESDKDEEASVDEPEEEVDECLRSWGGRELAQSILRGARGKEMEVLVFVLESAVDMRRVVGCMKEGTESMSMRGSWSREAISTSGSSSEKSSESVSYSVSSGRGEGASRSSSQRTHKRPL